MYDIELGLVVTMGPTGIEEQPETRIRPRTLDNEVKYDWEDVEISKTTEGSKTERRELNNKGGKKIEKKRSIKCGPAKTVEGLFVYENGN